MTRHIKRWAAILSGTAWLACAVGCVPASQEYTGQWESFPPEQPTVPQTAAPLTAAQLDQLTAPIALYSDPLVGMVLTAATYPLEVVEAARWLDADDHASLQGNALNAQLAQESWDTSIKALVAVPEVLHMMNQNLEWTEQLGDAFLSQQSDIMDSIQRLRGRAAAAGALESSLQQTVSTDDGEVVIEPVSPDVIYVPCYTPAIYGPWPWPGYPPFYFPSFDDYCYPGPVITFGIGFGVLGPYWGWGRWNWRAHGFYVVRPVHGWPGAMRPWTHNPAHRHGVPYPNRATAQRYLGPNASAWRGYRGYPATPARAPRSGLAPRAAPVPRAPPAMRPRPPAFESYGPGPRVRSEAARGAFSRSAPGPRAAPRGVPHGRGGRPD